MVRRMERTAAIYRLPGILHDFAREAAVFRQRVPSGVANGLRLRVGSFT